MKIADDTDKPQTALPLRTAQVLRFAGVTKLDLPPELVLDGAREAGLKAVVILGYDKDGDEYMASSLADGADVMWLMERLKQRLLGSPGGTDERNA